MSDKKTTDKPAIVMDKRLIDRQIERGNLSRDELDQHLKALPDLEEQADNIAGVIYPQQG